MMNMGGCVSRLPIILFLAYVSAYPQVSAAEANDSPSSISSGPLSVDQVVDKLIHKDQERARALQSAEATRIYHLQYKGFPGTREAEMTVHSFYSSPSTEIFDVISQDGSKMLLDHVFKQLLEAEKDAASMKARKRSLLNRSNYEFALIRYEPETRQYVLQVTPRSKSRFLYRGQIWVDGTEFAVTRIDGEPAENPSFWTKRSSIHHEFRKVQGFWVSARNESVSEIRFGGRAILTIEYKDYRLNQMDVSSASTSPSIVSLEAR